MAAAALVAGCTQIEKDPGVKVSSFGYDPADSTRFIQQALDSGAKKLILDRQAGPWVTLPLKMRSNTELIFEPGVELLAKRGEYKGLRDYLLELPHCTNVTIRGGAGAKMRMWKADYQGPDYKHGEWRYALRIFHCENVLVEGLTIAESGGDGIGITGKNITIRNCVCDANHRQGISVFSAENLLIENCVLRGTSGTPPQAGIDFEPDQPHEILKNCVMRNCLLEGNVGSGYELYLNQLCATSAPISLTFENCRSVGDRVGAHVNGGGGREKNFVKGTVRFINCSFESSRSHGITVTASPANAFDVVFTGCVVSNAAAESAGTADVKIGAAKPVQGPSDGIDLGDLTVYQPKARDWFICGMQGIGPTPTRIAGRVKVITPDGKATTTVLDSAWAAKNMPALNGGKPLPERVGFPDAEAVKVTDSAPGKMVDLSPVCLLYGARYVFYVERPGKVTFAGRQVNVVKGRPLCKEPITVTAVGKGGKRGKAWRIPIVSDKETEFTFGAPKAGFYRMTVPDKGVRFTLTKASVPVAIDVTAKEHVTAARGGRPFSVWFSSPGGKAFSFMTVGDSHNRFKAALTDPAGKVVDRCDLIKSAFICNVPADAPAGLWRMDFSRAKEPNYDWVRQDMFGIPGFLFLSKDKTWALAPDGKGH